MRSDVVLERAAGLEAPDGEHAREVGARDGRDRRAAPGRQQERVVRLLVQAIGSLDGYRLRPPIDCDRLVVAPEVDPPLLDDLPGVHHHQVLEFGDLALYVVRESAGAVRDPAAALEDDNVHLWGVPLRFPGRAHPGGVAADDHESIRHHDYLRTEPDRDCCISHSGTA